MELIITEKDVYKRQHDQLHRQLAKANEDDNVAASAALQGDELGTSALQLGEHAYHAHKRCV